MLYDPQYIDMTDANPFSLFVSQARLHRSGEAVRTGLFGVSGHAVPGHFFEAAAGFHFGECGPVHVSRPLESEFHCDVPAFLAIVILAGEWRFSLRGDKGEPLRLRKNMFLFGDWHGVHGHGTIPAQEEYCHVAVAVEKEAVAAHFGRAAALEIQQKLSQALVPSAPGALSLRGPAAPDALATARQLLHMRKNSSMEKLALRGAAVDFFTRVLRNAVDQDRPPATPLHDRDARVLIGLKERLEKDSSGLTAKELCAAIGMSESKANKGFKALFGTTIARHLHACKLAQAHNLLTRRQCNVSECAFTLGYTNIGHFIAAFRKRYGVTPRDVMRGDA